MKKVITSRISVFATYVLCLLHSLCYAHIPMYLLSLVISIMILIFIKISYSKKTISASIFPYIYIIIAQIAYFIWRHSWKEVISKHILIFIDLFCPLQRPLFTINRPKVLMILLWLHLPNVIITYYFPITQMISDLIITIIFLPLLNKIIIYITILLKKILLKWFSKSFKMCFFLNITLKLNFLISCLLKYSLLLEITCNCQMNRCFIVNTIIKTKKTFLCYGICEFKPLLKL